MSNAQHRRTLSVRRIARLQHCVLGTIAVGWLLALQSALAETHKFRVNDPAAARALVAKGARLIADYDSFQVIEADDAALPESGLNEFEPADQFDSIELNGRQLNTRGPAIQALRTSAAAPAGKGLHMVQFAGPSKPEWRRALEANGVTILNYLPHNAYLVYGDAPALASLQSWARVERSVQWDGRYLPDYKIHPRARPVDAKGNPRPIGTTTFAIQLVADANANAETLRLIDQLKLAAIRREFNVLRFHNVVVDLPPDRLDELAAMPDVISIQPYFTPKKRDERQDQIVAGNLTAGLPDGPGYLAWLSSKGFTQAQFDASGFVVDVTDSGIDNGTKVPGHFALYPTGAVSRTSRVLYNRLEGTANSGSTLSGCDGHGTINAHIIAGYSAFNSGFPHTDAAGYSYGLGVCPFVRIGSSVVFDPTDFTNPDYATLQTHAWAGGARISNNSWGSEATGIYDIDAQTYDVLVRDVGASSSNRQMVIVFAAGNAGPTSDAMTLGISSPATAKNIITVGSSDNVRSLSVVNGGRDPTGKDGCDTTDADAASAENVTGFSSRGPCDDGRMKPDLVAPGTHVTGGAPQTGSPTLTGNGHALSCFNARGVCGLSDLGLAGSIYNYFPAGQQFYTVSSGTSHAAPAVSGACALLRQYFINQSNSPPSPALTKACLMNSARYLTGAYANDKLWSPNQGMGELNLGLAFDEVSCVLRDQVPIDKFTITGQTRTFSGIVSDPGKPFRVTLAWTDAPGSPVAAKALVNNLNLTVNVGGSTYKGNVFVGAHSVTGGTADSLNNVESVFLPAGLSGLFSVTVSAANIAGDALNTGTESPQQDFALIIRNAEPMPAPVIALSSYAITAESCSPANGAIDAGETVTVEVTLQNVGTEATSDLVATLQATNGVVLPGAPQSFGALAPAGGSATRSFTFTASGSCGQKITPTFQLTDSGADLGAALMNVPLGTLAPVFRQTFDAVLAPALPAGWTSSKSNYVQTLWTTVKVGADSAPNAAFIADPTPFGVAELASPPISLPTGAARLTFRNKFDLERGPDGTAFDGGVLEIKIGSGPFMDIIAVGGSFIAGGYNVTLSTGTGTKVSKNPLAGRAAWSGDSRGYLTTTVNLPAAAGGQTIQLRWRCGFDVDNSYTVTGWWIDSIAIKSYWCCPDSAPPAPYAPEVATYTGLFYQTDGVQFLASGALTMTTTLRGAYSGTLQLGTVKFKFIGQLDAFGLATNVIPRTGTNSLTLLLQMDATDNHRVLGTVNGGNWLAELDAERAALFNAKTNPAPFAGTYTLTLPGTGDFADATRPPGDGYATVFLSTAGQAKVAGVLADGTTVSGIAPISSRGQWPLYIASASGQLLGWLTISNAPASDVIGWFDCIRLPSVKAKVYKPGFQWGTNVIGSRLQATAIPPLNFTNGSVVLEGGNQPQSFTNLVRFNLTQVINLSSNALKLTVSKGVFKGTVVNPDTAKSIVIQGVLLQKQNYGSGYFLGTNQSGRVSFTP